ncbi:MAG: hypothetical protein A2Z99_02025 [Treponema sp. GWB1_62_6]|nr:MAG: hypothetical protein A2001_03865 [Treponema sp. GWC1_61_84]OHE65458.1 MAG: hypothetical protein A2Z99_02025 [Treponema sp. GWB1_62_6]OHE74329.1 MAG: hypothetical protein A2413_05785 [Treponema sp. RIFOXYC1_FULL_61_9]HCM28999.1 hypothetical protein [Treponema sp.]
MAITKTVLAMLDKCYATAAMEIGGKLRYIIATEGVGPCIAFSDDDHSAETVWEGPGGTMNIVPIPGRKDEFLATQDFVPTFQAKESKIVHVKYAVGAWTVAPLMTVPYLHRFDVCRVGAKCFLVGATLALYKEAREDWTKPGSVWVGELPEVLDGPFRINPVIGGITKNHGFCRGSWKGRDAYLVSGVEGVFVLYLPRTPDGKWESERILDHEVSDIAVCDIDGDGKLELAAVEPFHGSKGVIYKEMDGKLVPILEHEYEFGHVVWGGTIQGKPAFLIGGRKGNRELNWFGWDAATKTITRTLIDNSGGASNIAVWHKADRDVILAANREIGEVALYEITR